MRTAPLSPVLSILVLACSSGGPGAGEGRIGSSKLASDVSCPLASTLEASLPEPLPGTSTAAPVGAVEGAFAVSGSGAARYSIPLLVPPGTAGMQPGLSIEYDSGNSFEGSLGEGMSLGGLSTIARCPRNLKDDGVVRGVRYDDKDPFCLDGTRLVETGRTEGAVEYRTNPETFTKVVAYTDAGWDAARGPTRFEVRTRGGLIRTYGSQAHARMTVAGNVVSTWWLDEERDRHHNAVVYRYSNVPGIPFDHTERFHVDRIEYTSNALAGKAATNAVVFEYIEWPSHPARFTGGVRMLHDRRISKIRMEHWDSPESNHQTSRVYRFDYEENAVTGSSLLGAVHECGTDSPATCMPPTRFEWLRDRAGHLEPRTSVYGGHDLLALADVSGDGLPDLITTSRVAPDSATVTVRVSRGEGDGRYEPATTWGSFQLPEPFDTSSPLPPSRLRWDGASALDHDGDGRLDLLVKSGNDFVVLEARGTGSFETVTPGIAAHRYLGGTMHTEECYVTGTIVVPASYWTGVGIEETVRSEVVDLNGDGISDLALCRARTYCDESVSCGSAGPRVTKSCDAPVGDRWAVALGTPGGLRGDADLLELPLLDGVPCDSHLVHFLDLRGDGKVGILSPPPELYDFSDEAACSPSAPCSYRFTELTSSRDLTTSHWTSAETGLELLRDEWVNRVFADLNGDGLPDVVISEVDPDAVDPVSTRLNRGDGTFTPARVALATRPAGIGGAEITRAHPIDFNGDGNVDLVAPFLDPACATWAPGLGWCWHLLETDVRGEGTFRFVPLAQPDGQPYWFEEDDEGRMLAVDANADGRHDLVWRRHYGTYAVLVNNDPQDLLSAISDGRNNLPPDDPAHVPNVSIVYGPLVDGGPGGGDDEVYLERWAPLALGFADGCDHRRRCMAGSGLVVTAYATNNGLNHARRVDLSYRDGRWDAIARKPLGFGARFVRDRDTGRTEVAIHDNRTFDPGSDDYPFAAHPAERFEWVPLPGIADPAVLYLSHTEIDNVSLSSGPSRYNLRRFSRASEYEIPSPDMTSSLWDLARGARDPERYAADRLRLRTDSADLTTVDAYGNVGTISSTVEGGATTTITRTFVNDPAAWILGLVDREITCSRVGADEKCRHQDRDYDAVGTLLSVWDGDPADPQTHLQTSYARDAFGNVVFSASEDAAGRRRTSCWTYDGKGTFPIASANGLGHLALRRVHPGFGITVATTDPNGLVTRRGIDPLGRIVEEAHPDGTTTTIALGSAPSGGPGGTWLRETRRIDRPGVGEEYEEYDMLGRLVTHRWRAPEVPVAGAPFTVTDPELEVTREYDALGTLWRVSTPHFVDAPLASRRYWIYEADSLGRLVATTTPWRSREDRLYVRRTVHVSDPEGTTTVAFDGSGFPSEAWDRAGTRTQYTYGPFDLLDEVTTFAETNQTTRYQHDAYGRVRSIDDPNDGITSYEWSGFDQITRRVDALGRVTVHQYDVLGRPTTTLDADGLTVRTYDPPGCLGCADATTSSSGVTTTLSYDSLTRPRTFKQLAAGQTLKLELGYDAAGRVSSIEYPRAPGEPGLRIVFTHDAVGNVLAVDDETDAIRLWELDAVDPGGRPAQIALGNGATTRHTYDQAKGLLARIETWRGTSTYQDLSYGHDARLNVTHKTDPVQGISEHYTYDVLDRLSCVSPTSKRDECSLALTYYPSGNIWTKSDVGTYEYDPDHPHAVARVGAELYGYDAAGNLVSRPDGSIEYTAFNLPKRYTTGGRKIDFEYDAERRRTVTRDKTTARIDFAGLYQRKIAVATGGIVEERYRVPATGAAIEIVRQPSASPQISYIHLDALGSANAITDADGVLTERRIYDVFGRADDPYDMGLTRRAFGGHDEDVWTDAVDMKGRIYDSRLGRFWQPDMVLDEPLNSQRWNRYSYALNNPTSRTDPDGWDPTGGSTGLDPASWGDAFEVTAASGMTDPNGHALIELDMMIVYGDASAPLPETFSLESVGMAGAEGGSGAGAASPYVPIVETPISTQDILAQVHVALDVGGFLGPIGPMCDVVNACLYLAEGDLVNAAVSGVAAIPIYGDGARGARDAGRLYSSLKPAADTAKVARIVEAIEEAPATVRELTSAPADSLKARPGTTLYHYTDLDGLNGILGSGSLNSSITNAAYGPGQYLTDIPPEMLSRIELQSNLGVTKHVTHYVEINVGDLRVENVGERFVGSHYLVPGTSPLDIRGRVTSFGEAFGPHAP